MAVEEKVKACNKALERAKNLHKDAIGTEENFLAEQLEYLYNGLRKSQFKGQFKSAIDWLERQIDKKKNKSNPVNVK